MHIRSFLPKGRNDAYAETLGIIKKKVMGWKTSMVIIENPDKFEDDIALLKAFGKTNFQFQKKTTFEECIYPKDKSINIGNYNGNIIISDDYQITTKSLEKATNLNLTIEEENLCELFPKSEIITVACHSVVNYHGYSIIKNGKKIRLKVISSDTPLVEFGQRISEEEKIYSKSYQRDGANFWKDETDPEDEFTENQLMEDFAFGIANRRLGVFIDQAESFELMEKVTFKKYLGKKLSFIKRISKILSN
jgi:hypothetical protein